jgi:hypothetical protein
VPRWVRAFVALYLGAFAVCGFGSIEMWPFTGWQLFSRQRLRVQTHLEARASDGSGVERALPFDRYPIAYRGSSLVVNRFMRLPRERQRATCDAWTAGARALGMNVRTIRIYEVRVDLGLRVGKRAAPGVRTLRATCLPDGGVQT